MRAEKEPHVRVQGVRALGGDESESSEGGGVRERSASDVDGDGLRRVDEEL